ncbi:MAG: hypothetical protein DSY46_04210 [Hydrogenimonas sp.]|nr:MAG: hypothetical protein DSY46_04210 [Hydrogenimonas sp.]
MNETLLMIAILTGVLLILVVYMAVKDREASRKFMMIESSIDGLNQELFRLSKEFEAMKQKWSKELGELSHHMSESELQSDVVDQRLQPLNQDIQYIQEELEKRYTELKERLEWLDGKVRQVSLISEHSVLDEQKILQLHEQGMDSASIAKQLRLGKGEVDLVLKFAKIHA